MLKIYKRGKVFHCRGSVNGQQLRFSCRTTSRQIAERIRTETEAKYWKGRFDGPGAVLTFSDAVVLYRRAGKRAWRFHIVEDYWKDTPVKDITPSKVRDACRKLYPNASHAHWNRAVITPTTAVINHASAAEMCGSIKVERFKVLRRERTPASWSWINAFQSASSPCLGALASFMFLTGARLSEALSVQWSHVDFGSKLIRIHQTKLGGDERLAHLPDPLLVALANLPGKREGRVFKININPSFRRQWRRTCERAGIRFLTPHSCRHGFATSLLQAGVDVKTVAALGGWRDATTVLRTYAHAMRDPTITDVLTGHKSSAAESQGIERIGKKA